MSSLSTPPASTKPQGEKNSPSLKADGISITHNRWYLLRSDVVQEIYSTCKEKQYAVIGSPPATGKTSLLQLLQKALEDKGSNVVRLNITDIGPD
jgi:energy-coupling factor transporter ATP-binding protein EcfA2